MNKLDTLKQVKILTNKIHIGNLILVNQKSPIIDKEELFSNELVEKDKVALNIECFYYLNQLLKQCNANYKIVLVSGYRTKKFQEKIYNDTIKESGLEFAKSYVAYPNTSEHQTGLAIDVGLKQDKIDFIRPSFPSTSKICANFKDIADKFGFINRYTLQKEKITKIKEEEWHFRYVGYPHSSIIKNNNFCLEEYIDYIKSYKINNPYKFVANNNTIYIYYVKANEKETMVPVEDNCTYKISGNNVDGFIITTFKNMEGSLI